MSQPHTAEQVAASIFYFTGNNPASLASIAHHDPDIMADRAGRALANEVVRLQALLAELARLHNEQEMRAEQAEAKVAALVAAGDTMRNAMPRIDQRTCSAAVGWDVSKTGATTP